MGQLKTPNEQLAAKDAQLEEATKQRASLMEQLTARDAQLKAADTAKASLEELIAELKAQVAQARAAAAAVPDTHDYNEAKTRSDIIDLLLYEAGWPLDQARDREYPVTGIP